MKEELNIVTEVGIFGDLNIEDPTVKKVKKKDEESMTQSELDDIINNAIKANRNFTI